MKKVFLKLLFCLLILAANLFPNVFVSADSSSVSIRVLAPDEQKIESGTEEVVVNPAQPILVLTGAPGSTGALSEINIPDTVSDDTEVVLDFGLLIQLGSPYLQITVTNELTIIRSSSILENNFELVIPAGTIIRDLDATWDGRFALPSVKANNSVSVPEMSGQKSIVDKVVEVGSPDKKLLFSKAVKLKLSNQAGKYAGYLIAGGVFTAIIKSCENNINPTVADNSDCKISAGDDLIIWTKHFTKFAVYSYMSLSPPAPSAPAGGGNVFSLFREREKPTEEVKKVEEAKTIKGDIDNNNLVDIFDFNLLFLNWGLTLEHSSFDLNNDNIVDIFDFNLLMVFWG